MPSGWFLRFLVMCIVASLGVGLVTLALDYYSPPDGDYENRQGSIHLDAYEYEEALEDFNRALEIVPTHFGALMGKAIVFLQTERYTESKETFEHLILLLEQDPHPDTDTEEISKERKLKTLAYAYTNLGILYDRTGQYQDALFHYQKALSLDEEAVSGPGFVYKILHDPVPATVEQRVRYLIQQFHLPEHERVFTIPEKDKKQRMYKPW